MILVLEWPSNTELFHHHFAKMGHKDTSSDPQSSGWYS
jgi:hypothetical protein